jgi:hypothetical protein
MNQAPKLPRIGGVPMHPLADMALPVLFTVAAAVTVAVAGWGFTTWAGMLLLPGISLVSFLFAWESYLFTLIFTIREVDTPDALRYVEATIMLALAYVLSALAGPTGGFVQAVLDGYMHASTWVGTGLLAYGWWQGYQSATRLQYLHPALLTLNPDQERLANDDHVRAFESIRTQVFGNVAVTALIMGIVAWAQQDVRIWGWSWLGAGLLTQTALAAAAVLVAARLKQEISWFHERVQTSPGVYDRWLTYGITLLIVPALLALLLPAGPRLPVERLFAMLPQGKPREIALPPQAPPPENSDRGLYEVLQKYAGGEAWIQWHIPSWVWYTLAAIPVLWLFYMAAKQLIERVGSKELKGIWAILAVVASWYIALWRAVIEALGPVLKQAVVTPAQAVGSLFGEAGAIGRYLPFHGRAPADPRAAVRFYFSRLQTEAGRKGFRRQGSATAAEYARQLAGAAPEQSGEIHDLNTAYEMARYSDTSVEAQEVSFARRAWVSIARALKSK